jgi:tetratricopeptide (TPR) repeat protein
MPAAAPRRGAPAPAPRALARRQQLGAESAREDTGTGEVQFDPGSSHKAKRKRLFIAVGAVLLFVVILGIVKVRMNAIAANNQAIDEQKAQQAAEDEVNKYYEDSKKQITSGNFKAALSNLKTAISKSKEYGLDERELQRRYDFVASELKNQEAIDAAKEMCDRGELAAAVEKLKTIPEDSFFRDKVSEIIEGCKKKIPDRVSQGKAAVEAKNWDAAKQAFTDITAVDPNNADAAQLSKDIEKAGVVVPVKVRPVGPKVTVCDEATAKALESFAAGKIDEAIGYTSTGGEDAKCKALKANLTAFKEAYLNLDGEGNVEKALAALRAIPGGTSTAYAAKIAQQGSGAFVKEGLKAMSADNFPKAFAAFSQAHTADPGNEVVNRNLGIIHQKAKELNEQAYIDIQQDPDKARKELEQILAMTGKDDPLHAKSVTRLKKLSGGGGGD